MPEGEFTLPTELRSYVIHYDIYEEAIISTIKIKVYFTGAIKFYISADGGSTWEQIVGLTSGVWKTYTLTTPGAYVGYYVLGDGGSTIYTKLDANGNIVEPAITIQMT